MLERVRRGALVSSVAGSLARIVSSQGNGISRLTTCPGLTGIIPVWRPCPSIPPSLKLKQRQNFKPGGKLGQGLQNGINPVKTRTHLIRSAVSTSSTPPVIAAKHPFQVELKARKNYAWCACGLSKKQPFCDGSHFRGAKGFSPLRFKLDEAKEAWLCGCKHTKTPPFCDGTHKEDFVQKS